MRVMRRSPIGGRHLLVGTMRRSRACLLLFALSCGVNAQFDAVANALGPLSGADSTHPNVGWVTDHAKGIAPVVSAAGALTVTGDTRMYLVQDYTQNAWREHRYERIDLMAQPLVFTLDLSGVPCGCLACVYLVAMKDPSEAGPNYCDMAENLAPGYEEGTCTELDILEANNNAMQTAIHTETGGSFGSGRCDKNGCFARVGGPTAPSEEQGKYGRGKTIDSMRPFQVSTAVDAEGAMTITLSQGSATAVSFDRRMAGNPQGGGVPRDALAATRAAQGKLALVVSMWSSGDMSWLDGGCSSCSLDSAHFTISDVLVAGSVAPSAPPPPPLPPPILRLVQGGGAIPESRLVRLPLASVSSSEFSSSYQQYAATLQADHPNEVAIDGEPAPLEPPRREPALPRPRGCSPLLPAGRRRARPQPLVG